MLLNATKETGSTKPKYYSLLDGEKSNKYKKMKIVLLSLWFLTFIAWAIAVIVALVKRNSGKSDEDSQDYNMFKLANHSVSLAFLCYSLIYSVQNCEHIRVQ